MTEKIQTVELVKVYPTRVWVEKDFAGTVHIKMQHQGDKEFDFIQIGYDYRYTHNSHQAWLAEQIVKLLGGATESGT